jgi:hypothetical protein
MLTRFVDTPVENVHFNFSYDVVRAAVEVMEKYDPSFELPEHFFL